MRGYSSADIAKTWERGDYQSHNPLKAGIMKIDHHVHSDSDDPQVVRKFISVLEENETIACLSGGHWRGDHLSRE